MIDLFRELQQITEAMDREGIEYALVGGLAYSVLVEVRATEDIDLLIKPEDWERTPETLKNLGYEDLADPMDFKNIRIRRLVKLGDGDSVVLDFILADQEDWLEGLKKATRLKQGNRSYVIAPAETIISLKEKRMSGIDRSDIMGLKKLIEDRRP